MKRLFDPAAIKAQISNLEADRDRIEQAIEALQAALRNIEKIQPHQPQFRFERSQSSDVSLLDAVKHICFEMVDGITRQRVVSAIERQFPGIKPNPSSVSAALINLSKGSQPMLQVALEGQGRSPTLYSIEGTLEVKLFSDEIEALMDETAIKGSGGWQSLWGTLQHSFDKATGYIKLTAELRAKIYIYYHSYGQGGWQTRVKRVFRREFPHLFRAE
jgi:hypothetical protein